MIITLLVIWLIVGTAIVFAFRGGPTDWWSIVFAALWPFFFLIAGLSLLRPGNHHISMRSKSPRMSSSDRLLEG